MMTCSRLVMLLTVLLPIAQTAAAVIWVEGEDRTDSSAQRHPWYSSVDAQKLSGGAFVSHWGQQPGQASYDVTAAKAGDYQLWLRANPTATRLSVAVNDGPAKE